MFELYSNIYITDIFTLNIYLLYTVIHLKYFDYYFSCSFFLKKIQLHYFFKPLFSYSCMFHLCEQHQKSIAQ